jgi:hypothetical protein
MVMRKKFPGSSALAKMRAACASLASDVTEGNHFGGVAFKAGGRMFATYKEVDADAQIVFALEPDHVEALLGADPRFERYTRAPNCVLVHASDVTDWRELGRLLAESLHLSAVQKKPKKRARAKR